jgi:hemolysin activation/secretion protein
VVKPWVGKYLTLGELQEAGNAIANFYQTKGRIAQVQVPPQKLDGGIVILQVLEGRLGAVNATLPENTRINKNLVQSYVEVQNPTGQLIDTKGIDRALFYCKKPPEFALNLPWSLVNRMARLI